MSTYLPSPSDPEGKQRLRLTDEQARLLLRIYTLDLAGLPLYRRTELEMAKGWGKSPFAAAFALAEFCGPVVFDGWDENGEPKGKPWGTFEGSPPPWVQIAAVSEDQTDNTYSAIYAMLVANDHKAATDLKIDQGRTRLYLRDIPGAKLEPVTASFGTREGQRVTAAVLDETHLWTPRNGGVKLARTIRRNAAKMNGRTLETTNAPILGEKSVAEQTSEDRPEPGVLHYARRPPQEPQQDWGDDETLTALRHVYGDATWIRPERLLAEIRDSASDWTDSLRFYFNWRTKGAGRAVDPRRWKELTQPQDVPAKTRIGLGFDGSVSRDTTALRGCTADGYRFTIKVWQRPDGAPADWRVDRTDVADTLRTTFERYDVGRMFADPPYWQTELEAWALEYGETTVLTLETNQNRKMAPAVDRWLTAIREGTTTHDDDALAADHVQHAHLQRVRLQDDPEDGRTKYVLVKGDDRSRIDVAVADVLAFEAAMTMPPATPAATYFIPISDAPTPKAQRTFEDEQAELARFFGDDDE
jgi:hypothetical protein